eukprot:CAMPEP_0185849320 /NCGR_PEP_ID=MMETSP1354-20130828/3856_1 /TAXON_ID=708628 /ORGANISM="Erythrolobus madagascarensis, Strain CCMP3276" /LENGTH=102 /DNA_ID=CAMNT_0028549819 /DNA_START=22 /DNA_END=330 /DNA_ORIENTATION=+
MRTNSDCDTMAFVSGAVNVSARTQFSSRAVVASRPAAARASTRVNMSMEAVATDVVIKSSELMNTALMIASKEGDFGGYLGPAIGLLSIGAIIVALSPPLGD